MSEPWCPDPETIDKWMPPPPDVGTRCAVCDRLIEPAARFFTDSGDPRHMLCEESP